MYLRHNAPLIRVIMHVCALQCIRCIANGSDSARFGPRHRPTISEAFRAQDPFMKLRKLLADKGAAVQTIAADASIDDVVQSLVRHHIGSLVVCEPDLGDGTRRIREPLANGES